MKTKQYLSLVMLAALSISCDSHTYEELRGPEVITGQVSYTQHIQPIIQANCLSCHGSGGISSFRPLGTYAELKDAVMNTNLLDRIQRQNGEPGQMPQTGRMPQDKIDLILVWNAGGLPEN